MRFGLPICALLALWVFPANADIKSVEYTDPTTRYDHGILGDSIEYGGLRIDDGGNILTITLPADHVFEDIRPRLADVDNDGNPEIIVIETDMANGAALAIYDETGKLAQTPHIGTSHRWLAPVGIADFNGDGEMDIAYIDRPHLAKQLRVWSFRDGDLIEIAQANNLTNHKIGWDFIVGGVRDCGIGPEMITADGAWRNVVSTRFEGGKLVSGKIRAYTGPDSLAAALAC